VVRPGKTHANVDHLSQLEPTELSNTVPIDDELPDGQLFVVEAIQSEYKEILDYLRTNQVPSHLSDKKLNTCCINVLHIL